MTLDISEAIALAKDLLQTSTEFRPHDPTLAAEFSSRAFEICDDLGIDPALIDVQPDDLVDDVSSEDTGSPLVETAPVDLDEEDVQQTSQQLRDLLQQQALVLQNVRNAEAAPPRPKTENRFFRLFSRPLEGNVNGLQSA